MDTYDASALALRVLFIEDSEPDCRLLLRALQQAGMQVDFLRVQAAGDLRAALAAGGWGLVVSDFNLPSFDGFEALAEVRAHDPDLPFILVSGTVGEHVAVEALKKGADDYVMKGSLVRLAPAVRRAVREAALRRERRQAEDALRASEARYRDLIAHAADGFFVCSPDGKLSIVNRRCCELSGYDEADLLAMNVAQTLTAESRPVARARMAQLEAADDRLQFECTMLRRDGAAVPVEISLRRLPEGNAEGIVRDISERRAAEAAVLEERNLLRGLMDNIPDFIYFKDRELRYLRVNAALQRQLAADGAINAVGRRSMDLLAPEVAAEIERQEREIFRTGLPIVAQIDRIERPGNRVYWRDRTEVPIRNEHGDITALVCVSRDVTARRRSEEQVRRLNRVYAMLSGINSLLVRVRHRDTLLHEACRIAVEQGGFNAAWVGMGNRAEGRIELVAHCGPGSAHLPQTVGRLRVDENSAASIVARTFTEGTAHIANDVATDPRVLFKRDHAAAGTRSLAIFPLKAAGETQGTLALYAAEPGFFDAQEIALLEELAGDVGFALEHIANLGRLDHLAYYDQLTGLPNRHLFQERLAAAVEQARRDALSLVVVVVDIDGFKSINDALGAAAGDELLRQVARRLQENPYGLEAGIRVARVGADQFAAFTFTLGNEADMAPRIEGRRQQCFGPPFRLAGTELRVSAKSGLALFPRHGADAASLFRNAEAALKSAKTSGEPYLFFHEHMTQQVAAKLSLTSKLRGALEREEFVLHYQPKVDLATGAVIGVEALIRWREAGRLVPPMEFIPLLEETGLIMEVGAWAMRQAVRDHAVWQAALAAGESTAPRVAVNVSPIQLRRRDFVATVADIVDGTPHEAGEKGPTPPVIDLEITESLIMEDFSGNIDKLNQLRDMGVGVAIDDFGTGYSSLAYLARLPVQALKIDRSFISTMLDDANVMTLVTTVITLAHSFGLKVVAEGVESASQARMLRSLRCDQMQGYLFSKPVPAAEIPALAVKPFVIGK